MKRNKYHIIHAWMLLFCFIAGQYMVYAHQHIIVAGTNKQALHNPDTQPKQTLTENCRLCDAMHHNTMAAASTVHFTPVVITGHAYKTVTYAFVSLSLILAAGRAPPAAC